MSVDRLMATLSSSEVFDLEQDRYVGAAIFPAHWPGYVYTLHRHHEVVEGHSRTSASGTLMMQEHSGTHIDALCHQALDMEMYGGVRVNPTIQTPRGFSELGVETIGPILRRGVLLDVAKAKGVPFLPAGYLVTGADLEQAALAQGVTVEDGDCVLVRTGWGRNFADSEGYLKAAGIGADGARWLAARSPYLCGADNVAFDVPENVDIELGSLPSHVVLIIEKGIYIIENLNLEPLSEVGCHEFVFMCLPLKLQGVTGSPVRPVAIAPGK
ncbi:MAG: cyclase family protein [Candidatus Nanopelagicales bacterium]